MKEASFANTVSEYSKHRKYILESTKKKLKMSIIGHGFVGQAVDNGFDNDKCIKTIIDPKKYNNDISDTSIYDDVFFVCLPTPMSNDGSINASATIKVVEYLKLNRTGTIIIKSTITPDIIEILTEDTWGHKVVYNPEFLTEQNANEDFINAPMHVFGGNAVETVKVADIYRKYSLCKVCPSFHVTPKEASFIKYGVNCYLATKVTWFNQFYDVIQKHDANFDRITQAMSEDSRIGHSHMSVPGFDGKKGYGGACFPKDTAAFLHFCKTFSLLDETISSNNKYRKDYEKDSRELEQNISFDS